MDSREVKERGNALQKALTAKEPTATIVTILKDLQKNVRPSEELLRTTQIGKIVNKVKGLQGYDPSIPRLASEIVSQWRNQIKARTNSITSGASTPNGNGAASPIPAAKSTPAQAPDSTPKSADPKTHPTGVHPDKRTWETDKVDKKSLTKDPPRNNSICLLYNGLVAGSTLATSHVLNTATAIEAAILAQPAAAGTFTSTFYKDRVRMLFQNLKSKSNPELRTRILSGAISAERAAVMTHDEMKSEAQKAQDAEMQKQNLSDAMVPQEVKSVSDHLECGKCKQKKVSFTQAQTRSADEPMTTFCECQNCGNRWKFS